MNIVIALEGDNAQYYSELHKLFAQINNISITGILNDPESVVKLIDVQRPDMLIVDSAIYPQGLYKAIQYAHNKNMKVYMINIIENKESILGFDAYLYKIAKSFSLNNKLPNNIQPTSLSENIERLPTITSLPLDNFLEDDVNSAKVVNEPIKLADIKRIQEAITYLFKLLGVPSHLKGYLYLKAAVEMLYVNPHRYNELKHSMYKIISSKFDTTQIRVSKGMRLAVLQTLQKGNPDALHQLGFRKYTLSEIGNDEHINNLPSTYCFIDALVSELYRILLEQ